MDEATGSEGSESLLSGIAIEQAMTSECVSKIKSPQLLLVATAFAKNISDISHLLNLPETLLAYGKMQLQAFTYFIYFTDAAKIQDWKNKTQQELVAELTNEFARLFEQHQDKILKNVPDLARKDLVDLIVARQEIRDSLRSFLAAATTSAWSAFETLASDMWFIVLNTQPKFAHRAVNNAGRLKDEKGGGLLDRRFSVDDIARYGFDLREHMGDLLKEKFKFSILEGIQNAYLAAFGNFKDIETVFIGKDLCELEATRHLILHRSGVVDKKFIRKINTSLNLGDNVPLNGAIVSRFVNASIEAGVRLITIMDELLLIKHVNKVE
ncbi:MAG TPA: hypothetical protein VF735_08515 [Pyrinomonadaceae bacterium]|jgi:hypothetical protein